jgi:hypothetical protein
VAQVHSLFIGLTTGLAGASQLKVLLVALSFHQFFEGVALGARLADASNLSTRLDVILSLVFSVSAPIGIACGIGAATRFNTNGEMYLLVQGTLDSVCAGILLYIGFDLLIHDFAADVREKCQFRPGDSDGALEPVTVTTQGYNTLSTASPLSTKASQRDASLGQVDGRVLHAGMFAGLWLGAGFMAYVGRYL